MYNNSWDRWTFTGGASYNRQLTEYYKQVNDLLGGDFYVDLNQFAEEDFKYDVDQRQNDINNPNRVVKVGDKFGYDYSADIRRTLVWVQQQYKGNRFDAFISAELNATNFHRTGYYQNGVFHLITD